MGVNINSKLSFKFHIEEMCKKASQKTKAILRIRPYLDLNCAKLLFNTYIKSIFKYCPLIWCSGYDRTADKLINRTHHRALKAVYNNHSLTFGESLSLNKSSRIHIDNLRVILIEVYKSLHKLNPSFMWEVFSHKSDKHNLRTGNRLQLPQTNTKTFGTNGILFRASILWNNLPVEIKNSKSVTEFKIKILKWTGSCCSCRLCN